MFISSKAGDWSAALATLCAKESDHIALSGWGEVHIHVGEVIGLFLGQG